METGELLSLKEAHIRKLLEDLIQLDTKKSFNEDMKSRLLENIVMWSDFLPTINILSKSFVDELNSPNYYNFPDKEKEELNIDYNREVREIILKNNNRFLYQFDEPFH